jgi:hypothetical protein
MDRQVAKQAAFLAMPPGGPDRCTGRDLRTAHAGLAGLTDEYAGRVIGHLAAGAARARVAEDDIAAAGPSRPGRRGRRPGRCAESLSAVLLTFDGRGYQLRAGEASLELARLENPQSCAPSYAAAPGRSPACAAPDPGGRVRAGRHLRLSGRPAPR